MAELHALIRLYQHELDERRRALTELNNELALLERQRQELEDDYAHEKAAVEKTGDISFTFAGYAQRVAAAREALDVMERDLLTRIEAAKELVMESFGEVKKYQTAQDERDRLEAEKRKAREDQIMDEIGLEGFRRKEDE